MDAVDLLMTKIVSAVRQNKRIILGIDGLSRLKNPQFGLSPGRPYCRKVKKVQYRQRGMAGILFLAVGCRVVKEILAG
ncbi:hypothetical protein [Bacillus sp. ISL-55]|uniref:hypothetical protein n=1 Tax=Bacillus sp. ISL-55 TaxID=2819134 RepID=UPI002570DCF4|nr:hypothetical protein [Bacillus sp. ISL-55]